MTGKPITARPGWSMPTDHATDQTFCPGCFEPCDDPDVEAFEVTGELYCRDCAALPEIYE